jgi:hypothetical protein
VVRAVPQRVPLPVLRAHEFEADGASAEAAGRDAAGSALVASALIGRWVNATYWPGLREYLADGPMPPAAYAAMVQEVGAARTEPVEPWFGCLLEPSVATDTHPSLGERLARLGVEPDEALRLAVPAKGPRRRRCWAQRRPASSTPSTARGRAMSARRGRPATSRSGGTARR